MAGSATGINLIAVTENKGVWWSNLIMKWMKTKMKDFYSFKKASEKIKQITLFSLPRFRNESGANATQTQIQSNLSEDPLLNWRCQHLISHTFKNSVWHNYLKQRVSTIFLSQGSLISLPVLIFQNPPPKYYISLCLALWTASNQTLSVCASLISHISDKISPRVGCRVSLLCSKYYCCFSSLLAATEHSRLVLSKSALFHNVNPKAGPFTSAVRRDWRP